MTQPPLGLIDPDNLKDDEIYLIDIDYPMFPQKINRLYIKGNYLVHHVVYWYKPEQKYYTTQYEFPMASLPWIIDRFENGFLKKPEDGGLSNYERSGSREFNEEKIGINAMAHCCAENLPGFNIWNADWASYITEQPPQEWDIPRFMLQDGLLAEFKKIAQRYSP